MATLLKNRGTYDQKTGTYTSPTGQKYSTNLENAKKIGAVIINPIFSGSTKRTTTKKQSATPQTTTTITPRPQTTTTITPNLLNINTKDKINLFRKAQSQTEKQNLLNIQKNKNINLFRKKQITLSQKVSTLPREEQIIPSSIKKYKIYANTNNDRVYLVDSSGRSSSYLGDAFIPYLNTTARDYINQLRSKYGKGIKIKSDILTGKTYGQQDYEDFQKELKKIKLMPNYYFVKDSSGNIVNIGNDVLGITLGLENVYDPKVGGIFLTQKLKDFYPATEQLKDFFEQIKEKQTTNAQNIKSGISQPKSLTTSQKLSPVAYSNYIRDMAFYYYKQNGGVDNRTQFNSNYDNKKFGSDEKAYLTAYTELGNDQIRSAFDTSVADKYGARLRFNFLADILPLTGLTVKTIIGVNAVVGGISGVTTSVTKPKFETLRNKKELIKYVAEEFGIGIAQGYAIGSLYRYIGKSLKLVKVIIPESVKKALGQATVDTIRIGLTLLGNRYIRKISSEVSGGIKNIAIGDKDYGISQVAKNIGILVGFGFQKFKAEALAKDKKGIPRGKDAQTIKKEITRLEKLKFEYQSEDYLKLKQKIPSKGGLVATSTGTISKYNSNQIKNLYALAKKSGYTGSIDTFTSKEVYVQTRRIASQVPKVDAQLKILRTKLNTGKLVIPKNVKNYIEYKRYGIAFGKGDKVVAIEFNYKGGKISNIGIKTATGTSAKSIIKAYKLAKDIGFGTRVKLNNVFVASEKRISKINTEDWKRTLSKITIKKGYIGNKEISSKQLRQLSDVIKEDLSKGNNDAFLSYISKYYKSSAFLKSQTANVVTLQSPDGYVSINIKKVGNYINIDGIIVPKGTFVSVGQSTFNVISGAKTPIKVTKIKTPKPISDSIKSGSKIVVKAKTLMQQKKLQTIVKNIQTNVSKPILRTTDWSKVSASKLSTSLKYGIQQLGLIESSQSQYKTVLSQQVKSIQSLLQQNVQLIQSQAQRYTQSQVSKVIQKQSSQLQQIATAINLITIIPPYIPPRPIKKPEEEVPALTIKELSAIKNIIKLKEDLYAGYNVVLSNRKVATKYPLAFNKSLALASYNILNLGKKYAVLSKSSKAINKSIVNRPIKIPTDYYQINKNKLKLIKRGNKIIIYRR